MYQARQVDMLHMGCVYRRIDVEGDDIAGKEIYDNDKVPADVVYEQFRPVAPK